MFWKVIRDRMTVIEPFVRSGDVLDLGCVDARPILRDSSERLRHKPDILFRQIVEINPRTVGLDIDAAGVQALREAGYQVECGNVETVGLGRRFDAIVAGEIIEHLENPGLFLRNMRRHLKPGGVLLISTPNPFYGGQTWRIWRYGRPRVHEEHLGWQDPITLAQLLRRTGYAVVEWHWIQPRRKAVSSWKRLLRSYFAHSFLAVARPVAQTAEGPEISDTSSPTESTPPECAGQVFTARR